LRKYLASIIVLLILVVPIAGASSIVSVNNYEEEKINNYSNQNFTHTVFVEYGTTTTCPYCVTASGQLYSIYSSGDLDFHYVSMVWDECNSNVRNRINELSISSIPDVYFDGKYKHLLGAQSTEKPYKNAINFSGLRSVPDIDIDVSVQWMGGGTLKITVNVLNNELEKYNGKLRVYIAEKVSRWNDNGGNPYHYAVIDIPIAKNLKVLPRNHPRPLADTSTFEKTWFGALYGFNDITKENIVVIASVFDVNTDYVVETASAEPVSNNYNLLQDSIIERFIHNFSILF
jgi:hypothetical protein